MSELWQNFDMVREISRMMTEGDHLRLAKLRLQAIYRKEKKQISEDDDRLPLETEKYIDPSAAPKENRLSCRPLMNKQVKKVEVAQQNRDAVETQVDSQRTHLRLLACHSTAFNFDSDRTTKNVQLRTPPSAGLAHKEASLSMAPKKRQLAPRGYQDPVLRFPLTIAFSGVSTAEREELCNTESAVLWKAFQPNGDRLPDIIICGDSAFTSLVLLGITRYIPILKTGFLHKLIKESVVPSVQEFEVERFPSMKQRFVRKDIQLNLNNLKLEIDVFPGSFSHPIIGGLGLALVLKSIGAEVVRSRRLADFIISDRNNPYTKSTVYKKVDIEWIIESILHSCIVPVEKYFF